MKVTANQKSKPSECVWTRDFLLLAWYFTAKGKACKKLSRNKDWIVQDSKCFHVFIHAHLISNMQIISVNAKSLLFFCVHMSAKLQNGSMYWWSLFQELPKYLRGYHKCSKEDAIQLAGLIFRVRFNSDRTQYAAIPKILKELVPENMIPILSSEEWKRV